MNTILKVDDINVYYGSIHAIKGISFEVGEGEVVTLIGANGAGKSTTLNTIAGLTAGLFADDCAGEPGDGCLYPEERRHRPGSGNGL